MLNRNRSGTEKSHKEMRPSGGTTVAVAVTEGGSSQENISAEVQRSLMPRLGDTGWGGPATGTRHRSEGGRWLEQQEKGK